MDWMIMAAQLLLSLSFLVAVHEFGHLLAAKYFGMRVEQFSIGFPPKIWSFRKGETEYALSAIPLGGYVKISGMIDESLDTDTMKQEPQPWEFRSKPAWQRLIVMLGGIIVNVIIGILIFIGITFVLGDTYIRKDVVNANGGFVVGPGGESIGMKTGDKIVAINGKDFEYMEDLIKLDVLLGENATYTVERDGQRIDLNVPSNFIEQLSKRRTAPPFFFRRPPIVNGVAEGTMADSLGVKKGDRIVSIAGNNITWFDEIGVNLKQLKETVSFVVERDGKLINYSGVFQKDQKALGVYPVQVPDYIEKGEVKINYGFLESIPLGTERAFSTLKSQVTAFGQMFQGKLSVTKNLSGPLGIMEAFGPSWDWARFWTLTGILSLVLAFMNLLPIPALDGGHVTFLIYEMVTRRKPSDKFLEGAQKVGMLILLVLMVFIFANDIRKLFGFGE